MKTRVLLALAIGSALMLTQVAADSAYQAKCPVSGQPAKAANTVDYKGGKVQFCCENCPKKFQADPSKYAAKAAAQMLGTGEMKQVACPLTGKPINPETAIDVEGVKVAFCCNNCKGATEKASDKLAKVFGGDLAKGFTTQTKCPVSGKPIDVKQTVDYQGKKVYFCCENCPAAFNKDPAKYASKLPQLQK